MFQLVKKNTKICFLLFQLGNYVLYLWSNKNLHELLFVPTHLVHIFY